MKKLSFLASLVILTVMASCSPSTKIIGSWSSPDKPAASYSKLLVTGLTSNLVSRQAFEEELTATLNEDGFNAASTVESEQLVGVSAYQ